MEDVTIKMFPKKKNKIKKDAINHYKNLSEKKKEKEKRIWSKLLQEFKIKIAFCLVQETKHDKQRNGKILTKIFYCAKEKIKKETKFG